MIPRTQQERTDLLRALRRHADQALRQSEHFGRLQAIERERAARIEAEIATLIAAPALAVASTSNA